MVNPLQSSCLENSMDGGTWWATVHGVAESDTTEDFTFTFSLFCDDIIKQVGNTRGADLMSLIQNQWLSKYPWNNESGAKEREGSCNHNVVRCSTVVIEVLGMK